MTTPIQGNSTTVSWTTKETQKTAVHIIVDVSTTASNFMLKEGAKMLLKTSGCAPIQPCADMAVDHLTEKSNVAYKNCADKSIDSLWGKITTFVSSFF